MSSAERIKEEAARLRKCSVAFLKSEVKRHHKVYDCSGMTKADLVFDLLVCRFGSKKVAEAYRTEK